VPFEAIDGTPVDTIDLRQIAANRFELLTAFRYRRATGEPIVIDAGTRTDLASVPTFLWWFVASHGRHTLPAVLHDSLVAKAETFEGRVAADLVFLEALADREIGWWRRRVIWSAVTYGTVWKYRRAFLVLMGAQIIAGSAAVYWFSWHGAGIAGIVLPVAGALVWGRFSWAVLLGTYVGPGLVPACLTVLATLAVASAFNLGRKLIGALPPGEPILVTPYRQPWP
jgi:uncharacterized protein DUF1353